MLEFPKNYFENEEREGFLVDTTMKTVWAAELEVLNEVAAVCAKYGLEWYAAYGTLLGAVRHAGFIPWDDDIDIWMKREDYKKALEVLPEELPEGYIVKAPHKRPGYPEYQVYVNNSDHISIEPERLRNFHGCPFYVGIDIFPLDEIPADEETKAMQRAVFSAALLLQELDYAMKHGGFGAAGQSGAKRDISIKTALDQIRMLSDKLWSSYHIRLDKNLIDDRHKEELLKAMWDIAEKLPEKSRENHQLANYVEYLHYGYVFEKACFDEVVYLPFEGFDIPAPKQYDAVLRAAFGETYMTPIRGGGDHEYPCYKAQLEELRRMAAETAEK